MARTQKEIEERFQAISAEVERLVAEADSHITEKIEGKISFKYQISAPRDLLTPFERAQSICFVTKYDALQDPGPIDIVQHKGRFYPNNIDSFRYLLNDYRPIIHNTKDSTHYSKVHHICRQKLMNDDPKKDLSITVEHESGEDVTKKFVTVLNQKNRAISIILRNCEFDYIYNGILQHSDHKFTSRFFQEYTNGELHYSFIKHAHVCSYIRKELWWHHYLLNVLSHTIMGAL